MDAFIYDFHTSLCIPSIQNLAFQLLHIRILGTHHSGNILREAFKCRTDFQYLFCCHDYAEQLLDNFHTKSNLKTMLAIYLYLFKALH